MPKTSKYLTTRIGDHWLGFDVGQIIEVLHLVAFTEVPSINNDILGLINVRDKVMPLVDMRRSFGVSDVQLKLDTPIIAIHAPSGPIAVIVDDADNVVEIEDSQITSYEHSAQLAVIRGVAQISGRLLLLVDTHRMSQEFHLSSATHQQHLG